ncbi:uncharacterized protein [Temnothorax longispinosus]|uniref:uncharacterized protein isoform X3 n=2 Tax=Temnothorax longispinosus TaxID=300112 RepID=UPI003A9A282D
METLRAAVRFYSDERRKVLIVPISDIQNFDRENCTNQPYYIKRHSNDDEHNSFLSPGEVLCVGSKEDLLNKGRRYKFSKMRRSDALQQLQMKQIERDGTPKRKTKITKKTLQKLGKKKNGQNELKKYLKNRKYLYTKNNNNEDTDLSNLSSSEFSTSYSTHSMSDTDPEVEASKNQASGTGKYTSNNNHYMSPITKEKSRKIKQQSRKIYSSSDSKQEDSDKNEVACTRQSSQLAGTSEELQQPEDRNETRGNQNQSLRASPNRPKRAENVNGNTPKRTTSIRRRTLYRLKNRAEPSDSDEEYADVYNNRLQSETRESVDNEGRELYDIEGDEEYSKTISMRCMEMLPKRRKFYKI